MEWVSGLYAAVAALAATRVVRHGGPGELVDLSHVGGGEHHRHDRGRPHGLAARPPEPGRPRRAASRPRRSSRPPTATSASTPTPATQFDSFLLMIERPDLIEAGFWAPIANRDQELGGVERDHPRLDDRAHDRRGRGAGRRAADPGGAGVGRSRGRRARAGGRPRLAGRRPERHRSECRAARGGSTVSWRRRRDRRRAWASTPAPSSPASAEAARDPRPPSSRCTASRSSTSPRGGRGRRRRRMLAALGADVIHVESVTRADGMRYTSGVSADRDEWWEYSALFLTSNTNKRDLTLDLTRPEGRVTRAAPDRAGRPRGRELHAARHRAVRSRAGTSCTPTNPRAVMVRMPAFGLDGPWRDRPGFAQTMEQVTGLAWLTGHVDDQPRIQRGSVRPERRHARGRRRARRARAARPHRRRLAGRVDHVRGRAQHLGRARSSSGRRTATRSTREGSRSPWAAPQGVYAHRHAGAVAGALGGDRRAVVGAGRRARATRLGDRSCVADARRAARRSRSARREARRVGGRDRPRQGGRPARLGGGPGGAGGRRPRARRSTRSTSPAATTSTREHPVDRRARPPVGAVPVHQRRPLAPPRGADARPAQPRDPHRPRPHRRRRSPRSRPTT